MHQQEKNRQKEKAGLHRRNLHRRRYDFAQLVRSCPELAPFVALNAYSDASIDFFDPDAVMALNRALLKHHYHVDHWKVPPGYLCPPIPGRADYIHHIADLLGGRSGAAIPAGPTVRCLDIGVGASCVYPIIGVSEYGWSFVGSEIDPVSLASAKAIVASNPHLRKLVELRLQHHRRDIFRGVIKKGERFDVTICNPPFHASLAEARSGTVRKLKNLRGGKRGKTVRNFGGRESELWCEGGEARFIRDMIRESREFGKSCSWFSTLVSKQSHLRDIRRALEAAEAAAVRTIPMSHGSKSVRAVAWTFLSKEEQEERRRARAG